MYENINEIIYLYVYTCICIYVCISVCIGNTHIPSRDTYQHTVVFNANAVYVRVKKYTTCYLHGSQNFNSQDRCFTQSHPNHHHACTGPRSLNSERMNPDYNSVVTTLYLQLCSKYEELSQLESHH